MIHNRTSEDVSLSKTYREKLQNGETLSESQIATLERGTMTINTLNRIEEKQTELKGLLNDMGYWNTNITNKSWDYSDIFSKTEFQRIINNLNTLRNAFFVFSYTPETPPVSFHYEDINSLEKILFDIDVMINDVKSRYRECGTFYCGEVNEK